jgi:hypothetical protein
MHNGPVSVFVFVLHRHRCGTHSWVVLLLMHQKFMIPILAFCIRMIYRSYCPWLMLLVLELFAAPILVLWIWFQYNSYNQVWFSLICTVLHSHFVALLLLLAVWSWINDGYCLIIILKKINFFFVFLKMIVMIT